MISNARLEHEKMERSSRRDDGFVLISVLGLLIVLSLVAAFVSAYSQQRIEVAEKIKQDIQLRLDEKATLSTLLHLFSTRQPTYGSLKLQESASPTMMNTDGLLMALDNRVYQGIGAIQFSLADESSLLGLIDPDRDRWTAYLQSIDVNFSVANNFLDQLQDYTDKDDLRRLNGAVESDYVNAGMTLPSHRFMVSPGQVFNLLSAPQWKGWLHASMPYITETSGQVINLNTMPRALLATLPGIGDELAKQIVTEREKKPFQNLPDANQRLGAILPLDALSTRFYFDNYIRVIFRRSDMQCRQQRWVGISLSPDSIVVPWEVSYAFDYTDNQPCQASSKLDFKPFFH
ncbi:MULTISPECIES: general secretion pathway protein GspK [Aeromonas]|uniref:general secretion pathway protein GspK n=1 Tax=Aeromonas TaxID=642 RepID=UPI001B5B8539|nr:MULTISPECIES: type II secretion system protein GspK [Aeromonas]MBP8172834.1 general secretion pathway protein GspK [Aeromonadaceae bacterium]MDX7681777.1 type II secretion system protein GspK [Aeromonas caviae]MDX7813193.1 type II secretion system protein GspK [Aeromonas caviae]MEA9423418.1 type II secretion system protein GspK [Aeromonas caviae]